MLDLFVQFVLIGWNYLCGSTWLAGIISLVRPDWLELFVQIPLDWREQLVLLPQLGWNYLCNVQILLIGWKYLFRSPLNGWNYMCRPPELAGIICATFLPLLCHLSWFAWIICAVRLDWLVSIVQFILIGWNYVCSSSWFSLELFVQFDLIAWIICAVRPDMLDLFVQFALLGWCYLCSSSWLVGITCAVRPDFLELFVQFDLIAWIICAVRPDMLGLFVHFVLIGWYYLCNSSWLAGIICAAPPDWLELFL